MRQSVTRARSRTGELNVATWNVCSFSLTGRRGAGHVEVLLQIYKVLGCNDIGLQEMQRPGQTEFAAAGYRVFCNGEDGSSGRAGQDGVGLAVKESIVREATWTQELTNERLMSMTFNLAGKSNAITFVVAYGPTYTVSSTREQKDAFWEDLDSAVSLPSSDNLFVLIDANARAGELIGDKDCKVIWAHGRDTRVSDSNGTSLLRFAGDNKLSLVNTFFSVRKGCTSRTFNGTRPWIRNVLTTSSRDNHTASLSEMSLFACSCVRIPTTTSYVPQSDSPANSPVIGNSEPPQGTRVLTDEQSRLTPTDANG